MILPKELKEALSNLASTEKDKLIFRLLKKEVPLANQLFFELVSEQSVDDKRAETIKILEKEIKRATEYFYSPGYLLMDVRSLSGIIAEHVSTTKDKFGEAWLQLFMLNNVLKSNDLMLKKHIGNTTDKFYIATIARVFKILLLIQKLHEDYYIEFTPELEKLAELIGGNHELMRMAMRHGLDVNWLVSDQIPENLVEIHKNIRENGFLR